jgi:RNA 3'-terminal phosphate cyclase (ATP)
MDGTIQTRLIIDGAMGEGGGQIIRTALTLAMLKKVSIEIINIRAKRNKPGLLRQHLTCVRAAKAICNAKVEGDELGSQRIVFTPNKVSNGEYHFKIGSAGSTALVCQTLILPLALAKAESKVIFEGGTHNGMSPSLTFLQEAYFPLLAKMGIQTEVHIDRLGFYPAGGGKWSLKIKPCESLCGIALMSSNDAGNDSVVSRLTVSAMVSQLPLSIAEREIKAVCLMLGLCQTKASAVSVETPGPGNILNITMHHDSHKNVFELVGMVGVSAENIAKRAVGRFRQFVHSGACVEEHLADQLLLPLAVAGQGHFCTTKPSLHSVTNMAVIKQFNAGDFKMSDLGENRYCISL